MIEMLTTHEATVELQRLESAGIELFGLDGFRFLQDGRYEAPIDLIIDFTMAGAPISTPAQRFAEARQFVTANDTPEARWEIVSGSEQV
ncbi:hypothetical protein [Sphingomonas sp.]|uniref:hypothetical protein n=1 Tax=Sphingomonas sp. TaxID=28214 RepID=UPI00286D19F8|nr:hypothetical protein [Sphingomonas sp.]